MFLNKQTVESCQALDDQFFFQAMNPHLHNEARKTLKLIEKNLQRNFLDLETAIGMLGRIYDYEQKEKKANEELLD